MSLLTILTLGLFLGVRHATDADHIVAVSAIVSRERSVLSALRVGALWGVGHTTTILLVGGAIVLLGLNVPERVGLSMELAVAVMLVVLGVLNLSRAGRHTHAGPEAAPVLATRGRGLQPFVVGTIHGLAGSAALALLVLTTIEDTGRAVLYLGVFGLGTIVGMMALTAAVSVPFSAVARRFGNFERTLTQFTGLVSVGFGLFLAYRIGFVEGLFLSELRVVPD